MEPLGVATTAYFSCDVALPAGTSVYVSVLYVALPEIVRSDFTPRSAHVSNKLEKPVHGVLSGTPESDAESEGVASVGSAPTPGLKEHAVAPKRTPQSTARTVQYTARLSAAEAR